VTGGVGPGGLPGAPPALGQRGRYPLHEPIAVALRTGPTLPFDPIRSPRNAPGSSATPTHPTLVLDQALPPVGQGLTDPAAPSRDDQRRCRPVRLKHSISSFRPRSSETRRGEAVMSVVPLVGLGSLGREGCSSAGCHADGQPQPLQSKPALALRVSLPGYRTRACSRPFPARAFCLNNHPDQKPEPERNTNPMTSTVTIVGNITRNPELRFTPTGQANTSFGVAVNRRWQNRQTQVWEESTSFFDIVAWGGLAENIAQCLTKGDRVVVEGRLDQRSWETNDGDKRSKVEITANEVAPSLRWATVEITKNERRSPQTVPAGNGASPDDGEEPF
jgi:single-strand DNA-binding protein